MKFPSGDRVGLRRFSLLFFPAVNFYYTETNFPLDKHPRVGFARFLKFEAKLPQKWCAPERR